MKRCLILTIVLLVLFSTCVFADAYEYNDYNIYTTTGVWVSSGALFSDNGNMSSFALNVKGISSNNPQMQITGGSWVNIPIPNGYEFNAQAFSNSAYISVNGQHFDFDQDEQTGQWSTGLVITTNGYPNVDIYFPYTNNGTGIPNTPILTISGNQLMWTPTGYATKIYYSATGVGQYEVLVDNVYSPYTISNEGFYRVQLHYTHNGSDLVTDVSDRVEYINSSSGGDTNIIQKILGFLEDIRVSFANATNTIISFVNTIGTFIQNMFLWLPFEIRTVLYAVIIIGLVFGLFIK